MKKTLSIGIAIVGLLVVLLGAAGIALSSLSSGQPYTVYVTVKEFKVMADSAIIPANVPIRFVVNNQGVLTHEVIMEKLGADDESLEGVEVQPEPGAENHAEIENVASNANKSDVWIVNNPGAYQLSCHVPGHYQAGMVTPITVVGASFLSPAMLLVEGKLIHSAFLYIGLGLMVVGIVGFIGFTLYGKRKFA